MNRSLAIYFVCLVFLPTFAFAQETPEQQRTRENDFIKELCYRQREYQSQYVYLSEKEAKTASELNDDITLQNQSPSATGLQRIDNLRAKLMENLQDHIKNDRDYIRYLEMRLSELVDYKFPTIKAIQQLDKDTIPPAENAPVILDRPISETDAPQETPAAAPGPVEAAPAAVENARESTPSYKRERVPLVIDESTAAGTEDDDARKFRETQAQLDSMRDESLKPRVMQDY